MVRTTTCEIVVNTLKCSSCKNYRSCLRGMYSRWSKRSSSDVSDSSSHTNNRYLRSPEKLVKIANLKSRAYAAEQDIDRLKDKIRQAAEKEGEILDKDLNSDLLDVMHDNSAQIKEAYPEGSFRRLYWEEQMKLATVKDARQVRWHPMMIKWCLNLKILSTAAYHAVRTSGCITLPSERTLRDYTHYFETKTGFQCEVNEQITKEANIDNLSESRRYVSIVIDEMKVKEDLVYNKHSGEMIGFVSLGDINKDLSEFEETCSIERDHPSIAKQLLVFMVRGLLFKLEFPYAHFTSRGVTADYLFPIMWEAVQQLEAIGLKVICITADGASPNRKFFRMHPKTSSNNEVTYRTRNIYAPDGQRWLYFVSDPPHLLKTVRNSWSHSSYSGTRLMQINGQHIEWKHLRDLYEKVSGMSIKSSGLTLIPKLKMEHVDLTSYSRMRVDLAAQVLSTSVKNGLSYFGDPATKETERFVAMFDKWFDCLNVRNFEEWKNKLKPDRKPYSDPNDPRLKWLENDFLGYLDEWQSQAESFKNLSADQQGRMQLSKPTIEGLRITVKSFVEMTNFMLSQDDHLVFPSEKISQDPLENYFGQQRARGGRNEHPTVQQCLDNVGALRLQKSSALDPVRGNCSRKRVYCSNMPEVDDTPLPKRRRRNQTDRSGSN